MPSRPRRSRRRTAPRTAGNRQMQNSRTAKGRPAPRVIPRVARRHGRAIHPVGQALLPGPDRPARRRRGRGRVAGILHPPESEARLRSVRPRGQLQPTGSGGGRARRRAAREVHHQGDSRSLRFMESAMAGIMQYFVWLALFVGLTYLIGGFNSSKTAATPLDADRHRRAHRHRHPQLRGNVLPVSAALQVHAQASAAASCRQRGSRSLRRRRQSAKSIVDRMDDASRAGPTSEGPDAMTAVIRRRALAVPAHSVLRAEMRVLRFHERRRCDRSRGSTWMR